MPTPVEQCVIAAYERNSNSMVVAERTGLPHARVVEILDKAGMVRQTTVPPSKRKRFEGTGGADIDPADAAEMRAQERDCQPAPMGEWSPNAHAEWLPPEPEEELCECKRGDKPAVSCFNCTP